MNTKKALNALMILCFVAGIASNTYARKHRTRNWSRRKKALVGFFVGGALGAGIGAGIGAGAAASCCCSKIGAAAGGGAAVGAAVGTAVGATRDGNKKNG